MLLAVTITCSFTLGLLVVSYTAGQFTTKPPNEESLQCTGSGMLMFQGDGRFSITRESGNGSLTCTGEVSVTANSTLYTRIISKGTFACKSYSNVRICGYGDTELIGDSQTAGSSHSLLQCNGELLTKSSTNTFCFGNGTKICNVSKIAPTSTFTLAPTTTFPTPTPGTPSSPAYSCYGEGNNFTVQGTGHFRISFIDDDVYCGGDVFTLAPDTYQTFSQFYCYGSANFTIELTQRDIGTSLNVSADFHNCDLDTAFMKFCSGSGEYSLVGEGDYNISTLSGNISCFGDATLYGLNFTTFGPFCCQGEDTFILDGSGLLYLVFATDYNNCSSLIDSTDPVSYNSNIFTSCVGTGANVFVGNGHFHVAIDVTSSNDGLKCDGNVSDIYTYNDTLYTYSYGQFWCISSGELLVYGKGAIDDENLDCNVTNIAPTSTITLAPTTIFPTPTPSSPVYSCYGVGNNFTITGIGHFRLSFTDDDVYCGGDIFPLTLDTYQTFSQFYCYGSANFTVELTRRDIGISLNVSADFHDCDLDTAFMKFCSGSGEYSLVGEGDYNISTLSGNISCFGDATSFGLYFTTFGPFCCQGEDTFILDGSGLLYLVFATDYDNCSSLIDSTDPVSYDSSILTFCVGTGANAFAGNGNFYITINTTSTEHGLKCDGSVSDTYMSNGTMYTYSYGQFYCVSSGDLLINGTGVIEDDDLSCRITKVSTTASPTPSPTPSPVVYSCYGVGNNFIITGTGSYRLSFTDVDDVYCGGDLSTLALYTYQTFYQFYNFYCYGSANFTIELTHRDLQTSLNVSADVHNCDLDAALTKHCTGSGEYSFVGEGNYNISTLSGNISCFGDVTSYDLYFTTFGPFCCQGKDRYILDGSGLLCAVFATDYDNCSSLIDSTNPVSYDSSILTSCVGTGANAFVGNGYFHITIYGTFSNNGLKCDGSVSDIYMSNGALYVSSYGQFRCISSGDLFINGTGVIEDDDIHCTVSPIKFTGEPLECSGTGEFKIIGSGFFDVVAIPEITCTGNGESSQFDVGERFISRGSFVCNGSMFFTLNGTGEIESVTTVLGSHNCTNMMPIASGSGVIEVVTCFGEGDYVTVGDGNFYINRTGPGMLRCSGEVMSGVNTSQKAEYFTNGEFICTISGIVYFTGIGRAEVINASTSYECNGVFFPGPTVEPPFSGFGGDEVTCFAYGEIVIVGYGQIHMVAQSLRSFDCQGARTVSSDLDQNVNVIESTGDFMCTGNGFVHITGRGEVFVNSTGFNNCTRHDIMISDSPLLCSGFGKYEIFGSANATIFSSDKLVCNGDVFPLTSSKRSPYYVGGYYRCISNGLFSISGVGNATIINTIKDTAEQNNYHCIGSQLLTCATFAFGDSVDENVTLIGEGEFTIMGDEELYCTGNVVLCPGKINHYFTDGYFYCSSNVFAHINGTGTIKDITGINNCSGFGFGVPPIVSGTPLTPQPSCIGFSDQYQISGNGTFNISRLIGSLNCSVKLQEPNSDVYTFSSNAESFNCNGRGVFLFDGTGDSVIILDNGYFNCIDLITVGPTMTALTVQEPDQMAVIQLMNFAASFPPAAVPFTITFITTDSTATGNKMIESGQIFVTEANYVSTSSHLNSIICM